MWSGNEGPHLTGPPARSHQVKANLFETVAYTCFREVSEVLFLQSL